MLDYSSLEGGEAAVLVITWLKTSCFPLFDIPKKEEGTTWNTSVSDEHFLFVCHAYSTESTHSPRACFNRRGFRES